MEASKKLDGISAEQVVEYLHNNRDFFMLRDELLLELNLPHQQQKGTSSLLEKQVSVLRERNIDMRNRLSQLTHNAQVNGEYFQHTRKLVLNLLTCRTIDAVSQALKASFQKDFGLAACSLTLFAEPDAYKDTTANVITQADAELVISGLINNRNSVFGVLRDNENSFLFKSKANLVGSAATIVLQADKKLGILAIGSGDPKHFSSGMDTLFLSFIADVVSRIIEPMLDR